MLMAGLSQKSKYATKIFSLFWTAMDWLYPPVCCNCEQRGFVFCPECFSKIETLYGHLCHTCGYPIKGKNKTCHRCKENPPAYDEARSWAVFSGVARKALLSLKYNRNLALGHLLARPLVDIIRNSNWQIDLVVPVPISWSRLRQRGYNQSACISRAVARELNLPHTTRAIQRVKQTETQIALDVNERFMNLMDAFNGITAKLNERSVLIIDDVITTGATMQNCAVAVKNAGAKKIYCLSVARTLLRHSEEF